MGVSTAEDLDARRAGGRHWVCLTSGGHDSTWSTESPTRDARPVK